MGIKYSVNEKFFDTWTQPMAYVLGYLYADGSLEDASYLRGKYVRVTSVEKYSILRIKKWLKSHHTVVIVKPTWPNGKTRYLLRIGSHKLYDSLTGLGLYPNKSLTIRLPKIPKKFLRDFVRGYFDGDGCVHLQKAVGKTKQIIIKRLSVIFTSGSIAFLKELDAALKTALCLKPNALYPHSGHRAFQLRYCTSDSILLFKFLYHGRMGNAYFKRKFNVFKQYFELRPQKIDKKIKNLLN